MPGMQPQVIRGGRFGVWGTPPLKPFIFTIKEFTSGSVAIIGGRMTRLRITLSSALAYQPFGYIAL